MNHYIRVPIGLLIVLLGSKAISQAYGGYDLGIFHEFQYISFGLLLVLTLAAFALDTTCYRSDGKYYQFVSSLIGLVLCGIVVFRYIRNNSIDKEETVMQVRHLPGAVHTLTFEFKANRQFRLTEYHLLGQTVYYGKYRQVSDTLFISENNYSGPAGKLPAKGIIRGDTVFWEQADTMLVERKQLR